MSDRPCKNCKLLNNEHQNDDKYYPGLCPYSSLSIMMQKEIEDGNIIPDVDWEWISYQPMNNLEWLEHESEKTL